MLHTILLVCCLNQFTVTVEKPVQSFSVQVEKSTVKEDDSLYVVMFSASYCGPCRAYKDSKKPDRIINSGTRVTVVDIDSGQSYYRGRVPRFWICRNKIIVYEFPEGVIEPEVIIRKVKELSEPKPVEVKKTSSSVYNGKPNNSHTNRQSLINHLSMDGIHRGKHSISYLNSLSDIELDNLHSLDHNNH